MEDTVRKLEKTIRITGTMLLLTGLRVGGYTGAIQIGGIDNPIIRDPLTEEPYVPGSSIKGKLRSLLEMADGLYESDGKPHRPRGENGADCRKNQCPVCLLFGASAGDGSLTGPARLIVRDARLTEKSRADLKKLRQRTGWNMSEIKAENTIDRVKIMANPRTMERIPAGTLFDVEFVLKVYSGDDEQKLRDSLRRAIALLEADYIGGSGSRGYGRVQFELTEQTLGDSETRNFYPAS